jgi:Transcription factor/nuclear export subunit protein 2
MKLMHTIGTPGYSTLGAYDNVRDDKSTASWWIFMMALFQLFGLHLADMIFCLSEHQVSNYGRPYHMFSPLIEVFHLYLNPEGRFYRIVFEDVEAWKNDVNSFKGVNENGVHVGPEDSAEALLGFQKKWSKVEKPKYESLLTLEEFKAIAGKWHTRLCRVRDVFCQPIIV